MENRKFIVAPAKHVTSNSGFRSLSLYALMYLTVLQTGYNMPIEFNGRKPLLAIHFVWERYRDDIAFDKCRSWYGLWHTLNSSVIMMNLSLREN